MSTPAFDVDEVIARVAGLRTCRLCGSGVPAAPAVCPSCSSVSITIPHTAYGRDVKRYLCMRAIARKMPAGMHDQYLFEQLLLDNYRNEWRDVTGGRRLIRRGVTIDEAFPYAVADTAVWIAANRPVPYTL